MKKIIIILILLIIFLPLVSQEEEPKKERKEKNPLKIDMGNVFIFQGEISYKILDIPFYMGGIGMDFQLGDRYAFGLYMNVGRAPVSDSKSYDNSTDVIGGNILFMDFNLLFKIFLLRRLWFSCGMDFELFLNGYYIDDNGTSELHTSLARTDEPNKMAFRTGLGANVPIGSSLIIIPALSVRYYIPITSGYSFSASDIVTGFSIGMGVKLSSMLKQFSGDQKSSE